MIKLILGVLVFCSVGISSAATAGENSGVYIYVAAGQSQQSNLANGNQDSYMGFLGYQLNSKWAIEGGYADLGKTNYPGSFSFRGVAISNLSSKSYATSLTVVRTWIVPDNFGNNAFSFLAKFGLAQVKSSASTAGSALDSYTKKGVTLGLGAKYDFDQNWSLRMDADSFDTGHDFYGRVPVYSLGLSYKF
jgi:opacity protein-like surface antigen